MTGEHVHHHVHETVQPVIHKETIQPEVVHTVVPIHEKHTAPSEHHGLSTLPMKTMDEFKQLGTDLTKKHHTTHEYEGHPRPYNAQFQEERRPVDINPAEHDGTHDLEKTGHLSSSSRGVDTDPGVGAVGGASSGLGDSSRAADAGAVGGTSSGLGDSSSRGNSAAMGSGVAGVAAGAAAADLGRDHTRAGDNTDLNSKDTTGPVGDSGIDTAGTSLGGRGEGNTVAGATDAATGNTSSNTEHLGGRRASRHEMEPVERNISNTGATAATNTGAKDEPTNLEGGAAEPKSSTTDDSAAPKSSDDSVQHASQMGEDPELVTSNEAKSGKMTGTGIDGSHSAVFGLTPDGHKFDDTKTAADNVASSASKDTSESEKRDSGIGEERDNAGGDAADQGETSRGVGTGKVAEQMHDPKVAEKGHDGQANYGDDGEKPGAGVATST